MKTIREEAFGNVTLRLLENPSGYTGAVIRKGERPDTITGEDSEVVWSELVNLAGQYNRGYFGFEGARTRFLRIFPEGFQDQRYLGAGSEGERDYKLEAVDTLARQLPLGSGPINRISIWPEM